MLGVPSIKGHFTEGHLHPQSCIHLFVNVYILYRTVQMGTMAQNQTTSHECSWAWRGYMNSQTHVWLKKKNRNTDGCTRETFREIIL